MPAGQGDPLAAYLACPLPTGIADGAERAEPRPPPQNQAIF
jgi:hypothetical protein